MKKLRGKYLVRKSQLHDDTPILIICGVFLPNFDLSEINNGDEMWVSDLIVGEDGIKFTDPIDGVDAGSPEDFLENIKGQQSPKFWKNKSPLK